jgi:hypothetical protein
MKNLSSPSELQAAIDGNRREGTERWNPQFECKKIFLNYGNLIIFCLLV